MSAAPEPLMTPAEVAQLFRVTEVMALLNGGAK